MPWNPDRYHQFKNERAAPFYDLLALVEDELLMSLPLVPMHTDCQSEHAPTSQDELGAEADAKPNPFAVLATMRLGKD